ncbi:MAG: DEAD/DEAH box helicase [Simkania sp.]|nr:DEAD/DEAH box helicase [Simkania sp.]
MNQDFFSKPLLKKGGQLLERGEVQGVQFSEGIYQFTIKEKGSRKSLFPILHIDDQGKLIDALCDCPKGQKEVGCVHLAAAWLKIFAQSTLPMHVRFRRSLWYALCLIVAEREEFSFSTLKKKGKTEWQILTSTQKQYFDLRALNEKGRKRCAELVAPNKKAQENSLKFSSLSPEEHRLWREGRAPFELRYRLSGWSELAEWLFLKQEMGEKYTVRCLGEKNSLPKGLQVQFSDVEVLFYVAESHWPSLIPKLATVQAPLRVFSSQYPPIQAMSFDEKEQALHVVFAPTPLLKKKGCKRPILIFDKWFFVPDLGFFPTDCDSLLGKKVLAGEEISYFLENHTALAQQVLVGCYLETTPRPIRYSLEFFEKEGLEISGYLFEPGDLKKKGSGVFGSWVYIPGKGFYRVTTTLKKVQQTIPIEALSSFITHHRLFLSEYEGFQIHLTVIEADLTYRVDANGTLRFDLILEENLEQEGVFDLGEWVYIRSRGFYPKAKRTGVLRAGLAIEKSKISTFIAKHRSELDLLPSFFSSRSPMEASGLTISLSPEERIVVKPHYQMNPFALSLGVEVFGEYTYVKGEGFFEIPSAMKLPELYTQQKVINVSNEAHFVMHQIETLKPFILHIDERLVKPERLVLKLQYVKPKASMIPSWNLELVYQSAFGQVSLKEIKQAISKGKSYLFTPAGLIMLALPRFTWLKELPNRAFKRESNRIVLTTLECLKLAAFEEMVGKQDTPLTPEDWQKLLESILQVTPPSLEGFKSTLRPYQAKGLEWLWTLYAQGLSGLLCDEMGLGKTHQAMALIAGLRNKAIGNQKQAMFLIVCPTTVIFHWQELFKRFLPGAHVLVFHGIQRNANQLQEDPEIVITSYGILRSERAVFKRLRFTLSVFDEIQVAKNMNSLTHRSLKMVQSGMYLGLTGTPIENRLMDLKALFDVVLPKYLPGEARFEQLFGFETHWEQDPKRKELLRQLIKPFLLRRKKAEVLTELPEKTEEVYYCSLSQEQNKLYQDMLYRDAEMLLEDLRDEARSVSYLHIFTLLTKLKQICDHPCLVLPEAENYFSHHSGKWELFVELLSEARESGQKVVVFSQFLKMLDIIEAYLDERGIGHAGIRGSTRDRQGEVQRFRDDPNCEVFVASLQAAGVGIDLVAASVVIHYDRWWNPAKENQATDRVHRIGQQRGVQVFKLVAKDTIEEHIDRIIQRKMVLVSEAIGFDDQETLKQFDRSDLIELLQEALILPSKSLDRKKTTI